jgi:hypothetical protein
MISAFGPIMHATVEQAAGGAVNGGVLGVGLAARGLADPGIDDDDA